MVCGYNSGSQSLRKSPNMCWFEAFELECDGRSSPPTKCSTLAQLADSKIFSKLDTNSGFWQVPLAEESRHLPTFLTPIGQYCFNKLPFGLISAPEHFQKCTLDLLSDIPGIQVYIDDISV